MSYSNYPPGVTGGEPEITGEWPCDECGGLGYDEDEDGKHTCPACEGKGYINGDESQGRCKECGDITGRYSSLVSDWLCAECAES